MGSQHKPDDPLHAACNQFGQAVLSERARMLHAGRHAKATGIDLIERSL